MANIQLAQFGKTCQARCQAAAREGLILRPCLRRSQKPKFQYLSLADGRTPEWCEARELLSLGAYSTPVCGESPIAAVESTLSAILESDVPAKYFLSKKACEGILRRAEKRGKELPPMLREALLAQCRDVAA
jgi:hypothetical protein